MKQIRIMSILAGVAVLSLWVATSYAQCGSSCGSCPSRRAKAEKALCKCGEVKGSKNCCNKDAKKCGACSKIAGSPGCKAACKAKGAK